MQLKLLKNHKLLIVGCGPEQLNAIFLAKEKGLHVIGVDLIKCPYPILFDASKLYKIFFFNFF